MYVRRLIPQHSYGEPSTVHEPHPRIGAGTSDFWIYKQSNMLKGGYVVRYGSGLAGVLVAGFAVSSCGSGSSTSSSPSAPSTSSPSITITVTSSGVSPNPMRVTPGTRVLFLNSDSRLHEMTSDPHPEHTDCPEINQVGLLTPGQLKETGNLNTVKTCGYHDHQNPDDKKFQGNIIIQ